MTAPRFGLTNVNKSFGGVHALKAVSFELLPGEVHALVGENGAGKSTLVKLITGALQPDAGTIEVEGEPIDHLTPARARQLGIACIYQQPALFPDLTVAENIALRLEASSAFRRIDWPRQREQARRLLERVGAEISAETRVRDLSMPHQQLVEIACAVGAEAHVVIMDEPTASLTHREQHLLFAVVRDLKERGAGVVYVSHRLEEVFALADRVTVLRDGEGIRTCPANDLDEASLIRLMVGRDLALGGAVGAAAPGPAVLSLRGLGCSLSGVRDINLDLRSGEILGLAGLVGAGRTELARTLFGITPADSGQIVIAGQSVKIGSPQCAVEQGIAYVPEDRARHGIILDLPIEQNITLAVHSRVFPRGWLRADTEKRLTLEYMLALDVKATGPAAQASSLSGGNQQKVSVARWLATKPKVLILDEPTQGVDVGAKGELHKIIRKLAGEGLAVLLISSELPEVIGLSDRIGVMRAGRLVALLPGRSDPHEVMAAAFGQTAAAE
jgi:rhamnose transport system ATP-binding protein